MNDSCDSADLVLAKKRRDDAVEALRLVFYARLPLGNTVEDHLMAHEDHTAAKAHEVLFDAVQEGARNSGPYVHLDFHVQAVEAATKHALTCPEVTGLLQAVDLLTKLLGEFGEGVPSDVQESVDAYNRKKSEVGL